MRGRNKEKYSKTNKIFRRYYGNKDIISDM